MKLLNDPRLRLVMGLPAVGPQEVESATALIETIVRAPPLF